MTQEHPITPPPELTQEWSCDCPLTDPFSREFYVATQAARWGADQELEACCEILRGEFNYHHLTEPLRAARRSKPPSLKEQALAALAAADGADHPVVATVLTADQHAIICRALEALPE